MGNILENLQNMMGGAGQGGQAGSGGLLGGLADILGGAMQPRGGTAQSQSGGLSSILGGGLGSLLGGGAGGGASKLLTPAAIGGLLGALLSSSAARSIAGGALLGGGGAMLWDKFTNRLSQEDAQSAAPLFGNAPSSSPEERPLRLVRALVFAARSDGHIDDAENQAIHEQLARLDLGADGEALVKKALTDPLDPASIAAGVSSEQEALELFALSRAVVNPDQLLEKRYLYALAAALHIPDDVRDEIMKG